MLTRPPPRPPACTASSRVDPPMRGRCSERRFAWNVRQRRMKYLFGFPAAAISPSNCSACPPTIAFDAWRSGSWFQMHRVPRQCRRGSSLQQSVWTLRRGRRIDNYLATHSVRKLQIGAGFHAFEGWLNTGPRAARVAVLFTWTRRSDFPLPDGSFDHVFYRAHHRARPLPGRSRDAF